MNKSPLLPTPSNLMLLGGQTTITEMQNNPKKDTKGKLCLVQTTLLSCMNIVGSKGFIYSLYTSYTAQSYVYLPASAGHQINLTD